MDVKKLNLDSTKSAIVGIDLGTTNSAVAIYSAQTVPTLLPIGGHGKYTMQSCVQWNGGDSFTVGEEAYKHRYYSNVCYSVKRIMGSDKMVKFYKKDYGTLTMTPAAVSAEILKALKAKTLEYYGDCSDCVITVPAYFNQRQISDTLEAAKMAKWNCRQILKEPTSASYIYSLLGYAETGSVLIYDLGGGTFDVTHMTFLRRDAIPQKLLTSLKRQYGIELEKVSNADVNDQYFCRVLGTYGDINLGGDDIDKELGNILLKNTGYKLTESGKEQLYLSCEDYKKLGVIGYDFTIEGKVFHVTSDMLDAAVDKIFERTLALMQDIDMSDVKTIVLVGGSTKSKRLREDLANAFPGVEISAVLDPDATVALGAGSVAKAISNDSELLYADVLPLPIGVLVNEKEVEVCIEKNTSMPYTVTRVYHTLHDNQSTITVHVYQGLSSKPKECIYLGRLTIENVPLAPAGAIDVKVSFTLSSQGRLKIISHVEGVDKEEELVIDNIFDVKEEDNRPADTDAKMYGHLSPIDSFEECFLPMFADNEEALKLFEERRQTVEDSDERKDLEDKIVTLMT